MIYEEAKLAMPSASKVVEVIKKISRKIKLGTRVEIEEWKWGPRIGQWCIHAKKEIGLIWAVEKIEKNISYFTPDVSYNLTDGWYISHFEEITPILDWKDDIEPILKKAGYSLEFTDKGIIENYGVIIQDRKNRTKQIWLGGGESRQMAVTNALLALETRKIEK